MLDSVGREIRVGDIITYAQRKGDTGGLTIARVVALSHPKRDGEQLVVKIPTEKFETVYLTEAGTIRAHGDYTPAKYVGHYRAYYEKQTMFEYPGRATVVIDRDVTWWMDKFKIGQTEFFYATGEAWPNGSAPCESLEDILRLGKPR